MTRPIAGRTGWLPARVTAGLAALIMVASACTGSGGSVDQTADRADDADQAADDLTTSSEPIEESSTTTMVADDEPAATTTTLDPATAAIAPQAETAEQLATAWVILHSSEPGDNSPDVQVMQERLAELGFAPGTPDGSYGRRTERAIEAFQGLASLPQTGIADPATMTALSQYSYDGPLVRAGDEGSAVQELQQRLTEGPFDPGPVDGEYGTATKQAVWALEKLAGVPVDGDWGPLDELAWQQLQEGAIGQPTQDHDQRWVEVDLSQQVAKVYDPGQPVPTLIVHISSGSGVPWANEDHSGSSITPRGEFHINRRINGWRESSLNIGRLYNPLYFNGGIAFHGATSVPLYPASHGCVRLPMHIAEYMPDELPNGTKVHVLA